MLQSSHTSYKRHFKMSRVHIRPKEPWVRVGGFTAHWRLVVRSQVWQPASFS